MIPGTGRVSTHGPGLWCQLEILCRLEGLRLWCFPTFSHPHKTLGETGSGVCVALDSLEHKESHLPLPRGPRGVSLYVTVLLLSCVEGMAGCVWPFTQLALSEVIT